MHIVATIRHAKQRLPKQCNIEIKARRWQPVVDSAREEEEYDSSSPRSPDQQRSSVYKEANKDYRESPEYCYS